MPVHGLYEYDEGDFPFGEESAYEEILFPDEFIPMRINWEMCKKTTALRNPFTWHESLEILYFIEGEAVVECGTSKYPSRAGDIVLINPCEVHTVALLNMDVRYHCLMLDPRMYGNSQDAMAAKFITPMMEGRRYFRNVLTGNRKVRAVLDGLLEECRNRETGYELAVKGYVFQLLAELFRSELSGQTEEKRLRDCSQIAPALRYVAENYTADIKLSDLSGACHMNRSYFCRVFHEITGRTAVTYINEYRLAKARTMLLTTDMTIAEVASRAGFADSGYFSRKFREFYGCSPSAARLHHQTT